MKLYLKLNANLTLTQLCQLQKDLRKDGFDIIKIDLENNLLYLRRAKCSIDYLKIEQEGIKNRTGLLMTFHLEYSDK
jgi:hypothetical protein